MQSFFGFFLKLLYKYLVGFDIGKSMVSKQTNEVETSERYKVGQR